MTILTKEQLLAIRLPTELLDINQWQPGAQVRVRALPAFVQTKYIEMSKDGTSAGNADVYTFVHAVVDEDGNLMWDEKDQAIIAQTMDLGLISVVSAAAWRLTRLSPEKQEAIKKNLRILTIVPSGEPQSPADSPTQISS